MILQRIRIIVEDAGFEPGTSAPEVWCSTNEPPHLQKPHRLFGFIYNLVFLIQNLLVILQKIGIYLTYYISLCSMTFYGQIRIQRI